MIWGYYIIYDYNSQEEEQIKTLTKILTAHGFDCRQNRFGSDCFRGNNSEQSSFLQWLFESLFFAEIGKKEYYRRSNQIYHQSLEPHHIREDYSEAISDDPCLDDQEEFELKE